MVGQKWSVDPMGLATWAFPRRVPGASIPREIAGAFRSGSARVDGCARHARRRLGETLYRLKATAAPVVQISRIDDRNIGDRKCAPREYFGFLRDGFHADIQACDFFGLNLDSRVVILGGGGIFYFEEEIRRIAASRDATLICWGAGHNRHASDRIGRLGVLKSFALVGVRDYGFGYEWVPCASAMDPAFDRTYAVEHDVVIYDHRDFRVAVDDPTIPRLSNSCMDFEKVIAFLGSAETVITSSYHGAYWAALLGRKAVVPDPFSTKFHGYRHPPALCEARAWRSAMREARTYPEALGECRAANRSFAEKVAEVIEGDAGARRRRRLMRLVRPRPTARPYAAGA